MHCSLSLSSLLSLTPVPIILGSRFSSVQPIITCLQRVSASCDGWSILPGNSVACGDKIPVLDHLSVSPAACQHRWSQGRAERLAGSGQGRTEPIISPVP